MGASFITLPHLVRAAEGGGSPENRLVRVLLASGDNIPAARQVDPSYFSWEGRTYRGGYAVIPLPAGKSGFVNVVSLESYLYGVVSREVSPAWPAAAQQAQAILSRTYATLKLHPEKQYDVVATSSDQRYGGVSGESAAGRAAVDETAGTIVTHGGSTAQVAFSACCGGRTADPADVWHSSIPYLRSIVDPHCAGTPEYRWEARVGYDTLRSLDLERAGTLHSVELREMTRSGRPRELAFAGSVSTINVAADNFRSAAGLSIVRSTYLRSVVPGGGALTIAGNGSGHGVGMCQWGAREMAAAGASAEAIIAFYFPTTTLQ
jgi:stage II sporulation protein D